MKDNEYVWNRLNEKDHCFIIAEAGSNHNGDLEIAKQLVDAACEARADAIKFQFFKAEKIAADTSDSIAILDDGKTLFKLYEENEAPLDWLPKLVKYCEEKDIIFFATPFDEDTVDLLEEINVPLYKVASFEIVHLPLLKKIARTGKPIIISSGMADLNDIRDALDAVYSEGNKNVVILHCGINYPLSFNDVNLRAMETIRDRFGVLVGYSDHTSGAIVCIAAVARGASVIEKHFTLSSKMKGPDHGFAIEPNELKTLVDSIRVCDSILGSSEKHRTRSEEIHYHRGRRSVFAARDIPRNKVLEMEDFAILRPGIGLKPKYIYDLIGKISKKNYLKHEPINLDIIKE